MLKGCRETQLPGTLSSAGGSWSRAEAAFLRAAGSVGLLQSDISPPDLQEWHFTHVQTAAPAAVLLFLYVSAPVRVGRQRGQSRGVNVRSISRCGPRVLAQPLKQDIGKFT